MSRKIAPLPSANEMAKVIRNAWLHGHITQRNVAEDLGIHQSQFSKLVNGKFKQTGGHAERLFEYSRRRLDLSAPGSRTIDADALEAALMKRLLRAWDGTPDGAKALEAILDGVARLRRTSDTTS